MCIFQRSARCVRLGSSHGCTRTLGCAESCVESNADRDAYWRQTLEREFVRGYRSVAWSKNGARG